MISPMMRFGTMNDALQEMERIQSEMKQLFSGRRLLFNPDYPLMNVWTNENGAIITTEMPGIDPENIDIEVKGETVTLSGSRIAEKLKEGEIYHRQERPYGRFKRTVTLPFRVNHEKVEALYQRGILKISLPRSENDKPKQIEVKVQ